MLLVKTGLLFCHPNFLSLQSSVEKAMLWQNGSRESKSYLLLDWFLLLSFLLLILRMGRLISLLKRKRKEKKKKQNIRRNESKEGNLSIHPIRSDPIWSAGIYLYCLHWCHQSWKFKLWACSRFDCQFICSIKKKNSSKFAAFLTGKYLQATIKPVSFATYHFIWFDFSSRFFYCLLVHLHHFSRHCCVIPRLIRNNVRFVVVIEIHSCLQNSRRSRHCRLLHCDIQF